MAALGDHHDELQVHIQSQLQSGPVSHQAGAGQRWGGGTNRGWCTGTAAGLPGMIVLAISFMGCSQGLCEAGSLVKVLNVMVGLRMYVFFIASVCH